MTSFKTSLGDISVKKAEPQDEEAVLGIMRDAAQWLRSKGIAQWTGVLTDKGPELVHQRIKDGVANIALFNEEKIGTVSVMFEDTFSWGEKGLDGSAGYIHGLAVLRKFSGKEVGLGLLKWAMETIKAEKSHIRLDCMAENPRLCRFYEEIGLSKVGNKIWPSGFKTNLYEK